MGGERGVVRGGETGLGEDKARGGTVTSESEGDVTAWERQGEAETERCEGTFEGGWEECRGGGETGGEGETGGSGDVMRRGRVGGRGETGGERGTVLWSCCCDREKEGGEGVKEEVEDDKGGGGKEVRGGGMEGEGRPGGGSCVRVEGETSAYGGNDTHINYEAESLKLNADSDGCISQSRGRDMEEIILHQRFFFFF